MTKKPTEASKKSVHSSVMEELKEKMLRTTDKIIQDDVKLFAGLESMKRKLYDTVGEAVDEAVLEKGKVHPAKKEQLGLGSINHELYDQVEKAAEKAIQDKLNYYKTHKIKKCPAKLELIYRRFYLTLEKAVTKAIYDKGSQPPNIDVINRNLLDTVGKAVEKAMQNKENRCRTKRQPGKLNVINRKLYWSVENAVEKGFLRKEKYFIELDDTILKLFERVQKAVEKAIKDKNALYRTKSQYDIINLRLFNYVEKSVKRALEETEDSYLRLENMFRNLNGNIGKAVEKAAKHKEEHLREVNENYRKLYCKKIPIKKSDFGVAKCYESKKEIALGSMRQLVSDSLYHGQRNATNRMLVKWFVQDTSPLCLTLNNDAFINSVAQKRSMTLVPLFEPWSILWSDERHGLISNVSRLDPYERVNYIFGFHSLVNRHLYFDYCQVMRQVFTRESLFQPFPLTWVMPRDYLLLRNYTKTHPNVKLVRKALDPPRKNISFPDKIGNSRVSTNQHSELVIFKGNQFGRQLKDCPCFVQEYIDTPFLIDDLKIYFSCFVLVTAVGNNLRVFVHEEAEVRLYNMANVAVDHHLTTWHQLLAWFRHNGYGSGKIESRVDKAIAMTMIAVNPHLTLEMEQRKIKLIGQVCPCFQLVQLNFTFDNRLMPHLIKMKHTIAPRSSELKEILFLDTFVMASVQDFKCDVTRNQFRTWLLERNKRRERRNEKFERRTKKKLEHEMRTRSRKSEKNPEKITISRFVRKYEKPSGYVDLLLRRRKFELEKKMMLVDRPMTVKEFRNYAINLFNKNKSMKTCETVNQERSNKLSTINAALCTNPLQKQNTMNEPRRADPLQQQVEWEDFNEGNFRCILPSTQMTREERNGVLRAKMMIHQFLQTSARKCDVKNCMKK